MSSVVKAPSPISGVLYEADTMDQHHCMIVDNMSRGSDDIESYVDAAGIENRVSAYWRIALTHCSHLPNLDLADLKGTATVSQISVSHHHQHDTTTSSVSFR